MVLKTGTPARAAIPLQHATTGSALFGAGLAHPICSNAGIATDRSTPLVEAEVEASKKGDPESNKSAARIG